MVTYELSFIDQDPLSGILASWDVDKHIAIVTDDDDKAAGSGEYRGKFFGTILPVYRFLLTQPANWPERDPLVYCLAADTDLGWNALYPCLRLATAEYGYFILSDIKKRLDATDLTTLTIPIARIFMIAICQLYGEITDQRKHIRLPSTVDHTTGVYVDGDAMKRRIDMGNLP